MSRMAICCTEETIVPSDPSLAFFEDRDEGSFDAINKCKCGYFEVAHIKGATHDCNPRCGHCNKFKPHGAYEYDKYYCGHSGWD